MVSETSGKQFITIVLIIIIILVVVNYGIKKDVEVPVYPDSIKIANWNLQIYGDSKAHLNSSLCFKNKRL